MATKTAPLVGILTGSKCDVETMTPRRRCSTSSASRKDELCACPEKRTAESLAAEEIG